MKIVDELVMGIGSGSYIQSNIADERQWNAIIVSEEAPPEPPKASPWLWIAGSIAILVGATAIARRIVSKRE